MAQMTMIQAITDAMRLELARDPKVLVFGEDVGVNGGVFRATAGLQEQFGEQRVFDTPWQNRGSGVLRWAWPFRGFGPLRKSSFWLCI